MTDKLILHFVMVTQFKLVGKLLNVFQNGNKNEALVSVYKLQIPLFPESMQIFIFSLLNFFVYFLGGRGWGGY